MRARAIDVLLLITDSAYLCLAMPSLRGLSFLWPLPFYPSMGHFIASFFRFELNLRSSFSVHLDLLFGHAHTSSSFLIVSFFCILQCVSIHSHRLPNFFVNDSVHSCTTVASFPNLTSRSFPLHS